jgi:ABC-2 type transport system permease protein
MSRPGSVGWFAAHEARLAWRDWLSLIAGGRRLRTFGVAAVGIALALLLHGLVYLLLASAGDAVVGSDRRVLALVTATLATWGSLMLSQALESATRVFYARGDLELILASPASVRRLFSVRVVSIVVSVAALILVLAAPVIDVLAWLGGARWLCAYVVVASLAMVSGAIAVALTVAMLRTIGPRRTRVVAQVVAAVVGAAFAVIAQFAAIASYDVTSPATLARLSAFADAGPDDGSVFWWPARAAVGDPVPLAVVLGLSAVALAVTIRAASPRFGALALEIASAPRGAGERRRERSRFRDRGPLQALRSKEWTLLLRDPWLVSQSMMQLLYLVPTAWLLWRNLSVGGGASALLVPLLIVAAGQLSGGLAWLAVSGEDAPELLASAPVRTAVVLRAKAEAVLGAIAAVFAPLLAMIALASPLAGLVACAGVLAATGAATTIQFWFRKQAKRSHFRRRQTSSRVATFSEAMSSVGWAGAGALAVTGSGLAILPAAFALAVLGVARLVSPAREPSASRRLARKGMP